MKEEYLAEKIVVTVEHKDHSGKLRKIDDTGRIYRGHTYGICVSCETPIVFDGEDRFMGTPRDCFKKIN